MKKLKQLQNNTIVKFVGALFLIGLITGIIFYFCYKPDVSASLEEFMISLKITHQNTFLMDIIGISLIFILGISIIGLPVMIFYLFYQGLCIGFTLGLFIGLYSFKGLLFYLLFIILSKLVFIAGFLYFSVISIKYVKTVLEAFTSKNKEKLNSAIIQHFYRFITVFIIILLNSGLIYLFANKIMSLFLSLVMV